MTGPNPQEGGKDQGFLPESPSADAGPSPRSPEDPRFDHEGGDHTPGPWRSAPSIRGSQGERLICAEDSPPLARVYFVKGRRAGANARLMAAAPDLLEALQWVMSAHGEQLHDAFDAAHKAIAKATGLEVSDVRDRASSRDEGGLRDEPENPGLQATGGENGR